MSDGDRSQDEIAASAIISMSNEARGNSIDDQVVPAIQAATPVSNATTSTWDRGALENQQELLRYFLAPPASRTQRSPSVKKLRKTDKTILTGTQKAQLLKEFVKAKSENRPMKWTELSKRSVFQNHYTPEVLRERGVAFWKAHQDEEERKKRVNATKLSVLNTFIKASNDLAKMQETLDELQAQFNKSKLDEEAAKIQCLDSEKIAADATAQLEKLQLDLGKAESVAESTKLRQRDLEKEIAQSKAALQSAENEKVQLEHMEKTDELDELKKRLDELYKEREVQEVEAASLSKMTEDQKVWISGLHEQLDIQANIASKASSDYKKLARIFNETLAELEFVKKQLQASKNTMEWITSVEKAVKNTAVHINDCMSLNHRKGYAHGK